MNECEKCRYSINMATRGSYAKGIAKRAEILDVALEVFAKEGYRGTSLRKVAQLCNLSLAGVMHYFDSKEDLLVQILRKRDLRDECTVNEQGISNKEELEGNFLANLAKMDDEPGLVALYVTMVAAAVDPDHPAAKYFKERYERLLRVSEEVFFANVTEPSLEERGQFRLMTRSVLAMADGLQQQWLVDPTIDVASTMKLAMAQIGDVMENIANALKPAD